MLRGSLYAIGFLAVIVVLGLAGLGLLSSPLGLLAFPAAMVVGFAFAGAGHGRHDLRPEVARLRLHAAGDHADVPVLRHVLPDRRVPAGAPGFVQATPLYRGVHLIRALTTGTPDATLLIDVVYLLAMGTIGLAITSRRLGKLLQS